MRRLLIGVLVLALAGCASRSSSDSTTDSESSPAVSSAIGTLKDVCGPGTATSSTAKGVTSTEIKVGVFSDVGFTQNSEFPNTAKVFTSWCNAQGGINGRKLVAETLDAKLFEVRQRMITACSSDFALVGGGAAFDGLGVKDRLNCLLPDYPGQIVDITNIGSDLQVSALGVGVGYSPYANYQHWLMKEKYPDSASSVGTIGGDIAVTKIINAQTVETLTAMGGTVTYSDLYPAAGLADWTPYAQAIKKKKVKGLVFNGDYNSLAKLEQSLTNIGYKLDWIDTNSNAYGPSFIKAAGQASLAAQHNYAALSGVYPLETLAKNPATKELNRLFQQYAPGAAVTLPAIQAFSAWLLFATSVKSCTTLTAKCVYEAATKQTAWTGGGLHAPADLSSTSNPPKCFNVEEATTQGWKAADFKPDTGAYRCDTTPYKYKKSYGKPLTLASVGKSLADLK